MQGPSAAAKNATASLEVMELIFDLASSESLPRGCSPRRVSPMPCDPGPEPARWPDLDITIAPFMPTAHHGVDHMPVPPGTRSRRPFPRRWMPESTTPWPGSANLRRRRTVQAAGQETTASQPIVPAERTGLGSFERPAPLGPESLPPRFLQACRTRPPPSSLRTRSCSRTDSCKPGAFGYSAPEDPCR